MVNALTPREIQTRIRGGASVAEVAEETGMDPARLAAFAGPVLAEREHLAAEAQSATIRRRGEAGSHRRLGELIRDRLLSRGLDPDDLAWDAWRQADLKWRIVARIGEDAEARSAEFVFDPKARFSLAHNADARWMIGEEPPGARPEDENTVDFHDELALVRATADDAPAPGDDVPSSDLMHETQEDTSQLDRLYDMLSGISEDSVRIYTGIQDPTPQPSPTTPEPVAEDAHDVDDEADAPAAAEVAEDAVDVDDEPTMVRVERPAPEAVDEPEEPTQDPLVEAEEPKKPAKRRRRAKVPSWDEIMFGGPR